jgi:hypothetical protein
MFVGRREEEGEGTARSCGSLCFSVSWLSSHCAPRWLIEHPPHTHFKGQLGRKAPVFQISCDSVVPVSLLRAPSRLGEPQRPTGAGVAACMLQAVGR